MYDIHPESINGIPSNIISVHSGDQNFSFVIVDEETTNHIGIGIGKDYLFQPFFGTSHCQPRILT